MSANFDFFFYQASSIRYVQLPDEVDQMQAIKEELQRNPRPRTAQMPPKFKTPDT